MCGSNYQLHLPGGTRFVEEESVVLAPGDLFGYEGYFHIGFGLPTDELEEGLARLSEFIRRHA